MKELLLVLMFGIVTYIGLETLSLLIGSAAHVIRFATRRRDRK